MLSVVFRIIFFCFICLCESTFDCGFLKTLCEISKNFDSFTKYTQLIFLKLQEMFYFC